MSDLTLNNYGKHIPKYCIRIQKENSLKYVPTVEREPIRGLESVTRVDNIASILYVQKFMNGAIFINPSSYLYR